MSGRNGNHVELTDPVKKLIQSGTCTREHVEKFLADAEKLGSEGASRNIRNAERLLSMLGDSNRIKMLILLAKHEMCVCEIQLALGLPQPTVSHHLALLEQYDLVKREKKGRWAFYKANFSSAAYKCLSPIVDIQSIF